MSILRPTRRAFLRGAAGALAVPWLPSLARAAVVAPKRLLVLYVPNGTDPGLWHPAGPAPWWEASAMLAPLADVRGHVSVITGLANLPDVGELSHPQASRSVLSGQQDGGRSFDQLLAAHSAAEVPFASLQLASERSAACGSGLCDDVQHVSWRGQRDPAPRDVQLDAVFRRVFTGASSARGPVEAALQRSVLDAVRQDLARYEAAASTLDRRRMQAWTDGLRDLENRQDQLATRPACAVEDPPHDPGLLYGDDTHVRGMLGLAVSAFQCDLTRVVTYMLGNELSDRPLDRLGLATGHHELSHTTWEEGLLTAGHWALGHYRWVLDRLAETPDVDGRTLLDNTFVLYLGGMGNGGDHSRNRLPVLLGGRGGGSWTPGAHIAAPEDAPLANLLTSIGQAYGLGLASFGQQGTGSLLDLG